MTHATPLISMGPSDFSDSRVPWRCMTVPAIILAVISVLFFLWLLGSYGEGTKSASKSGRKESRSAARARRRNERRALRSQQVGMGTGLMGGSIEDAVISRYSLNRSRGDVADADLRDVATSVGMQDTGDQFHDSQ